MEEEARNLENWLNQNYHGEMAYMENHFDLRTDPTRLVPGAKTVISLMYNYYTPLHQEDNDAPRISMYALGKDYHKVVRKKLKTLLHEIRLLAGDVQGRVFVDSAPILERDWAKRSGLGWMGKNTLLISPAKGSWFFLGEIIIDTELSYDLPIKDHCGTCRRCIEACPTQAISSKGYLMDGSKCISYLTIELKNEIPSSFEGKMENWVFGCDICQQVCPWNRFSQPHKEGDFNPHPVVLGLDQKGWEDLSQSQFDEWFGHTPLKRTGFEGLQRNLRFLRRRQDD
ncbi:MAG: tRNA epoxyqueuosine(34) reductase QueG [Saprospiraceae bacterium]|nr:tRNA epoxyqueuosine(34) reductase QueG [Saprospiraceae bacterium]